MEDSFKCCTQILHYLEKLCKESLEGSMASMSTHCDLIKYLYGGLGIKGELLSRYLMFYGSVCNITNRHT